MCERCFNLSHRSCVFNLSPFRFYRINIYLMIKLTKKVEFKGISGYILTDILHFTNIKYTRNKFKRNNEVLAQSSCDVTRRRDVRYTRMRTCIMTVRK